MVGALLRTTIDDHHVRKLWSQRIHFVKTSGPNVADRAEHRQVARATDPHNADDVRFIARWRKILCTKLPLHWNAYDLEDQSRLLEKVFGQLAETGAIPIDVQRIMYGIQAPILEKLCRFPHMRDRPGLAIFPSIDHGHVLCPLDRDIKRMALLPDDA
jgi:hypothetical protein